MDVRVCLRRESEGAYLTVRAYSDSIALHRREAVVCIAPAHQSEDRPALAHVHRVALLFRPRAAGEGVRKYECAFSIPIEIEQIAPIIVDISVQIDLGHPESLCSALPLGAAAAERAELSIALSRTRIPLHEVVLAAGALVCAHSNAHSNAHSRGVLEEATFNVPVSHAYSSMAQECVGSAAGLAQTSAAVAAATDPLLGLYPGIPGSAKSCARSAPMLSVSTRQSELLLPPAERLVMHAVHVRTDAIALVPLLHAELCETVLQTVAEDADELLEFTQVCLQFLPRDVQQVRALSVLTVTA